MSQRLTLIVPTVRRPACALRLIDSALSAWPTMYVCVVDQDGGSSSIREYCADRDLDYVVMDGDPSLTRAKNVALRRITTDYFFLADDDMVFDLAAATIEKALAVLDQCGNIAFLGGDVREHRPVSVAADLDSDTDDGSRYPKARNVCLDETGRGLIILPAQMSSEPLIDCLGAKIRICDFVPNFGIGRRSAFGEGRICWDERYRIRGEHFDFVLERKQRFPAWKFAFWDALTADHRPLRSNDYNSLRYREGWTKFSEKWGVDYVYYVGGNLRRFSSFSDAEPLSSYVETAETSLRNQIRTMKSTIQRLQTRNTQLREWINRLKSVNAQWKDRLTKLKD